MRKLVRLGLILLFLACLSFPAGALTYTDDFDNFAENSIQSYSNLMPLGMEADSYRGLPDRTAFTLRSLPARSGHAQYTVRGASEITVGVYTLSGCYVDAAAYDGITVNTLGYSGGQMNAGGRQASFSPSLGAVYATVDGALYKAHYNNAFYQFVPSADSPSDLVGYGVNVYVSENGGSWSRVPLRQSALHPQTNYIYISEEWTGAVPAGTRYIRVELNDVQRFPVIDFFSGVVSGVYEKNSHSVNCITNVTISGENLRLGAPEPEEPEPYIPLHNRDREDGRESSTAYARAAPSAPPGSSSGACVERPSRYEGSKFEGVIEVPASSRGSSTRSASPSSPRPPSQSAPETPEAPASGAAEIVIGETSAKDRHFTAGVTAYIIGVVGALLSIVLFSSAKKKLRPPWGWPFHRPATPCRRPNRAAHRRPEQRGMNFCGR